MPKTIRYLLYKIKQTSADWFFIQWCLGYLWLASYPIHAQEITDIDSISIQNEAPNAKELLKSRKKDFISEGSVDSLRVDSTEFMHMVDSSRTDSIETFVISPDALDAEVAYDAQDSIVYDLFKKWVYLYGKAEVKYEAIELTAPLIILNMDKSEVTAFADFDSSGKVISYAVFTDSGQEYKAHKFVYNFKSGKGKVFEVRTQEGDGFVLGREVKRNENNEWFGLKGRYTTCDADHPHFYIQANKMKMVPDQLMVTGPANLVIADVPTPLYLPFGIFPLKQSRTTGLILPQYGEEAVRGFFLREGGYYFHISDYIDLAVTGDIYTSGSWAVRTASNYRKRYKYSGNVNFQYGNNRIGEPEDPNFNVQRDFIFRWQHAQDSKARPSSSFSANVNFGSSRFDRNFSQDQQRVTNAQFNSNISYSKSFPGKPFNFSVNMQHDQSLVTNVVNISAPVLSFGVSRLQPFKSKKIKTSQPKWYENIGFAYRFDARSNFSAVDSVFFTPETFRNARFGASHNIPINTSFNVLKYITVQPTFNYNERWYFKTIRRSWDPDTILVERGERVDTILGRVVTDTISEFRQARYFDAGVSLTTVVYGTVQFKNSKLKAIRHVLTPSLNFNYVPDFSTPFWRYYRQVQRNAAGDIQNYSVFEPNLGLYGGPSSGTVGGIGLTVNNILEMKVFSAKDSVRNEKKIRILDNLQISTFYNLAADSFNLNPINISGYTAVASSKFVINFGMVFDPYAYDSLNRRINRFQWQEERKFTRWTSATVAFSTNLNSKARDREAQLRGDSLERQQVFRNIQNYYDFTIPWNVGLRYNLVLSNGIAGRRDTLGITVNNVQMNFEVNVTDKWKLNMVTGYDLIRKDLVFTEVNVVRDLHCWVMNFRWVPYPLNLQSYSIDIQVKSPVLQDLKLSRRRSQFDSVF